MLKNMIFNEREIASYIPLDELEKIYNLEMARADKIQRVLDWLTDENTDINFGTAPRTFKNGEPVPKPPEVIPPYLRSFIPEAFIPNRPKKYGRCTAQDCPVEEPHLVGLWQYDLGNGSKEAWRHTKWFGYSDMPPDVLEAVRRLVWGVYEEQGKWAEDITKVTAFRNCHYWVFDARFFEGDNSGLSYREEVEQDLSPWKAKMGVAAV